LGGDAVTHAPARRAQALELPSVGKVLPYFDVKVVRLRKYLNPCKRKRAAGRAALDLTAAQTMRGWARWSAW
jgi:hypothetical protein